MEDLQLRIKDSLKAHKARPLAVVFEGTDKSGKSTLAKAFNTSTGWKFLVFDRLLGSKFVYDAIYSRPECDVFGLEKKLLECFDIVTVLCKASSQVIVERLGKEGHDNIISIISHLQQAQSLFDRYLLMTPTRAVEVDTTDNTIERSLHEVMSFVFGGGDNG